jgi:hypothetical protein
VTFYFPIIEELFDAVIRQPRRQVLTRKSRHSRGAIHNIFGAHKPRTNRDL